MNATGSSSGTTFISSVFLVGLVGVLGCSSNASGTSQDGGPDDLA